jgi:hypothetical protein
MTTRLAMHKNRFNVLIAHVFDTLKCSIDVCSIAEHRGDDNKMNVQSENKQRADRNCIGCCPLDDLKASEVNDSQNSFFLRGMRFFIVNPSG